MSDISRRMDVSLEVLGYVGYQQTDCDGKVVDFPKEGKHYETLAYTDWADHFQPTIIRWADGFVDSFEELEVSRQHRDASMEEG